MTSQYSSAPQADTAVEMLRRFLRTLIRWDRVTDDQVVGLAKCLTVLHEFPRINSIYTVHVCLTLPVYENQHGRQHLFWNLNISPREIEATIAGYFRGESGADSLTLCEFTAVDKHAQYDDYLMAHTVAVTDGLWLPSFADETLEGLDWNDTDLAIEVEMDDDALDDTGEVDQDQVPHEEPQGPGEVYADREPGMLDRTGMPGQFTLQNHEFADKALITLATDFGDQVTSLSLSCSSVTDAGLSALSAFEDLNDLSLLGTQITDAAIPAIMGLTKLVRLDLSDTGITNQGLLLLCSHERLETLRVEMTTIGDPGLTLIPRMPRLADVSFDYTDLTDGAVDTLAECRQLRRLSIRNTYITLAGYKALRACLPKSCEIDWEDRQEWVQQEPGSPTTDHSVSVAGPAGSATMGLGYFAATRTSFPLHCEASCLSELHESGWVLVGFPDGMVGAWNTRTQEYLLRMFCRASGSRVVGLAWGEFPIACATFSDTTVLIWDVVTGNVHKSVNHDACEARKHEMRVDAVIEAEGVLAVDMGLLGHEPVGYSMGRSVLGGTKGFVYYLIEPGYDSCGNHVMNAVQVMHWSMNDSEPFAICHKWDVDWVKLRRANEEDAVLIVYDNWLMTCSLSASGQDRIIHESSSFESPRFVDAAFVGDNPNWICVVTAEKGLELDEDTGHVSRTLVQIPDKEAFDLAVFSPRHDHVLLRAKFWPAKSHTWWVAKPRMNPVEMFPLAFPAKVTFIASTSGTNETWVATFVDRTIRLVTLEPVKPEPEIPF